MSGSRTIRACKSPAEVLFVRGVARACRSVDDPATDHAGAKPGRDPARCSRGVPSEFEYALRSVASVLRDVASASGRPTSGVPKSPRSALAGVFQTLKRAAHAKKGRRMGERFADPSRPVSRPGVSGVAYSLEWPVNELRGRIAGRGKQH
jgi:hypothetical protein